MRRTLHDSGSTPPTFDCNDCNDTGWLILDKGAAHCECRKVRARVNALERIPAEYRTATLSGLRADPSRHRGQADAIAKMRANPHGNFVFSGVFGTGKTMMFWTLYRHAIESGRICYGNTLRGLIDAFQKCFDGASGAMPPVTAADFRQTERVRGLFLDDIDKARPTEYVAEQFFDLLDAAQANNHQIVVTTNLRTAELMTHFERADAAGRYGGGIVRRLLSHATEIELF
jgi:DNA replication protein DnaC